MACFIDTQNKKTIINLSKENTGIAIQYNTYFNNIINTMKDLKIKGVSSITDDGKMTLYSNDNFYECENLSNDIILTALSHIMKRSLIFLLKDLDKLNPNIDPEFFCVEGATSEITCYYYEYYNTVGKLLSIMEKTLEEHSNEKIEYLKTLDPSTLSTADMYDIESYYYAGPCFIDGRDDSCAWTMTLPPRLNAQILADIIRKTFIGIGGIINGDIFFMKEGYTNSECGYDYSHCVSHEIDHDALTIYYYHPKTIGQYLKEQHEEFEIYPQRDIIEQNTSRYVDTEYYSDEVLKHLANKNEDDSEWCNKFEELMEKEYERKDPFPLYTSNEGNVAMCEYVLKNLIKKKELLSKYSEEEKTEVGKGGWKKYNKHPLWNLLASNNWNHNVSDEEIIKARLKLEKARENPIGYHYIKEIFCGFQYMIGVPFDLQVEACAIVAGVSPSEMIVKLNKASGL